MLSITRPRLDVATSSVRRYTFGSVGSSGKRGVSGPKKITVGCVILTVPRLNSVSQAVIDATPSESIEIVLVMGSGRASLFPLSQNRGHDSGVARAVQDGKYPERLLVR